ncbi:MAG TPA: hypothetical protein VFZ71_00315, partial [Pyrinomonadaceae bacterium]
LRTVFTHDHFGPSTHQQTGLYAGLVVEPKGSKWRHPETGVFFGGAGVAPRFDGGPTSWRADIITANIAESYREFLLEFADFQLAYDGERPVNPPARNEPGLPFLLEPAEKCPFSSFTPPCPEAIAAAEVGTMSVNYRNEPVALRVRDPGTNKQAAGLAGDLSHVYRSNVLRADGRFNVQPTFYPPLTADVQPGDPFTPLLRAYEDDPVQIRILVGAHEEGHNFGVNGIKWRFEPSDANSGFRNNQMMGISEHFEFIVPKLPRKSDGKTADYLYQPGKGADDQWNGLWGLMRVYATKKVDLLELPNNPKNNTLDWTNQGDFNGVCPKVAPVRNLNVTAVNAKALPAGTLVYNPREINGGRLHDPTAIMYFRTEDIDPASKKVKAGVVIEPLILRAGAGDCINLTLTNFLPTGPQFDLDGFNTMPMIINQFNANQVRPSSHVGLHPQLVFQDVTRSDGMNIGFNPVQTAAPGQTVVYQWYAGDVVTGPNNTGVATPIEFGSTALSPSDPIKHTNKGAIGALIIEPKGSFWNDLSGSRAQVNIFRSNGTSFREFVTIFQNDINMRFRGINSEATTELGIAVPNLAEAEDPEDSGQKAVNYRTEPLWKRMGFAPNTPLEKTREFDFTKVLTNDAVGGDPVTPVFEAGAGQEIRVRMVHPGGHPRNDNYLLHGHIWEQEPYVDASRALGSNPLSNWVGSQGGVGPGTHFDFLPKGGAGGRFHIPGDFLYRTFTSFHFDGGIWGILRVTPFFAPPPPSEGCTPCPKGMECPDVCTTSSGTATPDNGTTPAPNEK